MVGSAIIERAVPIPVHRAQLDFLRANATYRGFVGGRGAGKSFVGAYDLLKRAKADRFYIVGSPTTATGVKDVTYPAFKEICKQAGMKCRIRQSDYRGEFQTFDGGSAKISFRSAENPDDLRGPNVSGIWLDESSQMRAEVFDIAIACLREGGENGWLSMTFTPKGRAHWTYKAFYEKDGNGVDRLRPDTYLVQSKMSANPFLSVEYIETVTRRYGSGALAKQELEGNFVDFGGMFEAYRLQAVEAVPVGAERVRYWDRSYSSSETSDWTVGILMAHTPDGYYWIEDMVRGQWESAKRNEQMKATAAKDKQKYGDVKIWIEQEPGPGKETVQIAIKELKGYSVRVNPVAGTKKEVRADPFAAQVGAGNVRMLKAPWNDVLVDELSSFPDGDHDDIVDACSGAFNKLALGGGTGQVFRPQGFAFKGR